MAEGFWSPLAYLASTDRAVWQRLDDAMRRVLDSIKVRRVQRDYIQFYVEGLGTSTSWANAVLPGATALTQYFMPRNGYVIGLSVLVDDNIGGGGYFFEVMQNGSATGIVVDTGTMTQVGSTDHWYNTTFLDYGKTSYDIQVEANDTLGIRYRAGSGPSPTGANALVTITFAMTGED